MISTLLAVVMMATPLVLEVPGLTCPTCVKPVQKTLALAPGVERVMVDLETRKVTIEFDATQTDEGKLRALLDQAGFPANAAGGPAMTQGKADWVKVGAPPPDPALLAVSGKATVVAVCMADCSPCDAFKKDLVLMGQRVSKVAIREVMVTDAGSDRYLPAKASLPYAYVYDLGGKQVYAGSAGGDVYVAVEKALGVVPAR